MNVEKINHVAESLEWLAERLRRAAAGDSEAASLVRCFARDWCGMTVFGTAVITADVAELLEIGNAWFAAAQAADRDDAEHACVTERA